MQIIASPPGWMPTVSMSPLACTVAPPPGATPLSLQLPGGRVAALRWGRPGARQVLAVHGWLDNAASFDFLAPQLCAMLDLELVAIDMPGHGLSDWCPCGYAPASQAGRLLQVLDALEWKQADLIGHSLGGLIATLVAAAVPERVRSLCCLDALGGPAATLADCVPRLRRHLLAGFQHPLPSPQPLPSLQHGVRARQQANGLCAQTANALVRRGMREHEGMWHWRTDPQLTLPSAFYLDETQIQAVLAALRMPTLVVVASHGPLAHAPQRLAMRRACLPADALVITLAGGHYMHMDQATTVARHLLTLLSTSHNAPPPSH